MSLIALCVRRKDEKVESLMDKVLEVEEEWLQSSFRWEGTAFRYSSNTFLSESTTNKGLFEVRSSVSLEIESCDLASDSNYCEKSLPILNSPV